MNPVPPQKISSLMIQYNTTDENGDAYTVMIKTDTSLLVNLRSLQWDPPTGEELKKIRDRRWEAERKLLEKLW